MFHVKQFFHQSCFSVPWTFLSSAVCSLSFSAIIFRNGSSVLPVGFQGKPTELYYIV